MKHEQIMQRSKTVDGLLDDALRGANQAARPWSISELAPASSSWVQIYQSAKQNLDAKQLGAAPEKQIQNRVLHQQLDSLNKESAGDRKEMLGALIDNDKHFSSMEASASKVQEALLHAYYPAAIEIQQSIVANADKINSKALAFELDAMKHCKKGLQDESEKAALDKAIEESRSAMATPFIERARLASMLLADKKPFQAEKMLDEALKTQIPAESAESPFVKDLRKNAGDQLSRLRVENHLLEMYDANLSRLGISSDGVLTTDKLKAARAKGGDDNFKALTEFLNDKYSYLTRKHWTLFGQDGIRRSDIIEFEKERSKNINDLKLN
jgi:hypothetical protein